jgi:urease accessory protein
VSEAAGLLDVVSAAGRAPGSGLLRIVRERSRSVASRVFATSPLKLLTPRNHGSAAWVYTATYGGGLVDGDAVHLSVDVGPGAAMMLSTQAATKVYRSPRGTTTSGVDAVVRDGALLALMPDPVVCFAGSSYEQTQRFRLGRDASLVLVDWLSSGRRAAGERWAFDRYLARTSVHADGRLVWHDALSLNPLDGDLATRMGRFEVIAVVGLFGARLRAEAATIISRASDRSLERRADLLLAASPIGEDGALVRIAGSTAESVGRAIRECLHFVPALLGDDPWQRKW